ncbi:hypothetical protein [Paracoccus benzoatiresistens]|uniref:Integrase catalytic domain-containing protein n=1 Tax=Paracoccus benzoatiresistens TaxID=2997341 RepID=A0ABT4JBH1_9RHOB|nr:hypothetical protein [Paracoccus sp. EF6]MCZ0964477.1 hypothetical protein [Paracoccus sp. EF6]
MLVLRRPVEIAEAAPIIVREGTLVVETLERIRLGLPFALTALNVDNGSEFVNEKLIDYCLGHGIELTRSRPYRKNDQAWIEQKNGAVIRKLLGYRRFEGLAAAMAITRLYGASRLFVNFFQPSFKLASKQRDGAKVTKRYHPAQTPCERLLQAENVSGAAKNRLSEIAGTHDPLKLLEEMRRCRLIWQHWRTAKHPRRRQRSHPISLPLWQACRVPGTLARSVRHSPLKPSHFISEACKSHHTGTGWEPRRRVHTGGAHRDRGTARE